MWPWIRIYRFCFCMRELHFHEIMFGGKQWERYLVKNWEEIELWEYAIFREMFFQWTKAKQHFTQKEKLKICILAFNNQQTKRKSWLYLRKALLFPKRKHFFLLYCYRFSYQILLFFKTFCSYYKKELIKGT